MTAYQWAASSAMGLCFQKLQGNKWGCQQSREQFVCDWLVRAGVRKGAPGPLWARGEGD